MAHVRGSAKELPAIFGGVVKAASSLDRATPLGAFPLYPPPMGGQYQVDLDSIETSFPQGMPLPSRLRAFAGFVAQQRHGTLGWFDAMQGEPLDENVLDDDDATRIAREKLGLFLSLPDGSQLALWWHEAKAPPAVVLIESEGQHETLAPTLEAFLISWSRGETGVNDLDDADAGAARGALAEWLGQQGIEAPKVKAAKVKLPSLSAWFRACVKEAKAARDAAAKAKGSRPRRAKPALGTPTAASVADLVPRALPLLEKLITEPDVNAFFAELGFDVIGISKPDVLRNLVIPDLGLQFQIDWPWGGPSKRLEEAFPRAVRDAMQRDKSRMFWSVEARAEGERSWNNGTGGYVEFKAFPGRFPGGVLWTDTRDALIEKLGTPTDERSGNLYWEDDAMHRRHLVSFGDGERVPKDKIARMVWRVK